MKEFENLLSEEEIKSLREYEKKNYEYEKIRSHCTHIDHSTKKDSLRFDPKTEIVTCSICGASFKLINTDIIESEIAEKTQDIINIIQTLKIILEGSELDENNEEAWKLIKLYEAIAILKELPSTFASVNRQYNINNAQNFNAKGFMPLAEKLNKIFSDTMQSPFTEAFAHKYDSDDPKDKDIPDIIPSADEYVDYCDI